MTTPTRFNVLGTRLDALSLGQARELVVGAKSRKQLGYVCHATAYNLNIALSDPELRQAYRGSLVNATDGMPLVWLARARGHRHATRVYGPDLMSAACDAGRAAGLRHFLFGGLPGVADNLKHRLEERFPGIEIAGTFVPPFRELTPGEFERLQTAVRDSATDIVWVGLSSPKQEKFMCEHWRDFDASLLVGVGAAFDFLSGRVRQAPRWMQRGGFEWLFRLCVEPRRLWRRYLIHNPLFLLRAGAQLSGLRSYPDN